MAKKTLLVPIANGTEELEAISIIDTLKRCGVEVSIASIEESLEVTCSQGTTIKGNCFLNDLKGKSFDCIAVPGGMPGAKRMSECPDLIDLLKKQKVDGKLFAAICASPAVVFEAHGLINGPATCFPSFQKNLKDQTKVNDRVVVHENCITSQGAGSALEFALALAERMCGEEVAKQTAQRMLFHWPPK